MEYLKEIYEEYGNTIGKEKEAVMRSSLLRLFFDESLASKQTIDGITNLDENGHVEWYVDADVVSHDTVVKFEEDLEQRTNGQWTICWRKSAVLFNTNVFLR